MLVALHVLNFFSKEHTQTTDYLLPFIRLSLEETILYSSKDYSQTLKNTLFQNHVCFSILGTYIL